ncbi:hypothetical protein BDQ12DRAFT_728403 [Crucibulum laeve]|uniref:Uncharacterized protein n=1 Tax=Crucibulum laeve TaxID=68775 RepID=A0A5C3LVG3_9AGAR|nr:hypothetical protein BDQ12DRAFT_728403 [Crucibulum laeve]
MANIQNTITQSHPPQIMNNTILYTILNTIKILEPLRKAATMEITVDDTVVYTSSKLKKKIIPVLEVNQEM